MSASRAEVWKVRAVRDAMAGLDSLRIAGKTTREAIVIVESPVQSWICFRMIAESTWTCVGICVWTLEKVAFPQVSLPGLIRGLIRKVSLTGPQVCRERSKSID